MKPRNGGIETEKDIVPSIATTVYPSIVSFSKNPRG